LLALRTSLGLLLTPGTSSAIAVSISVRLDYP
jgi:hypothetical protein